MFSFLAQHPPARIQTAHLETIEYEDGKSYVTFKGPKHEFPVIGRIYGPESFLNPPPHFHLYQTEDFEVIEGSGVWELPLNEDPAARQITLSADAATPEGRKAHIPVGAFHYFKNFGDKPLVVGWRLDEQDWDLEEWFFRNLFGYFEDCRLTKTAPSVFQLCLLLYHFNCPLGVLLPGPLIFKRTVSRVFTFIVGQVIGGWLLGYKKSYPEYYAGPKKTA